MVFKFISLDVDALSWLAFVVGVVGALNWLF